MNLTRTFALSVFGLLGVCRMGAAELPNPSIDVPPEWATRAEATDFAETPRYADTLDYCRRLAEASPWIDCQSFGTSPQGRDLILLVASKDGAFTPEAARQSGKLIVLAQNCIHAGECAGKDASLMLMRDIAITRTREDLLDSVILLVMPIFNVDGHERFSSYSRINQNGPRAMGWRVTSRNLNLNRDYMKADAVEMHAWLEAWNAWRPHFMFDNHSTDGGDWQYDLMYSTDAHQVAAPSIAHWVNDTLLPRILPELADDGHKTIVYFGHFDPNDPAAGIHAFGGFGPRYSTDYCTLRNAPAILVETHALKPYRTRVIGHYNIMRRTLEELNRHPDALHLAVNEANQDTIALGSDHDPDRKLPLRIGGTDQAEKLDFQGVAFRTELSEVSGATRIIYEGDKPIEISTRLLDKPQVTMTVTPPLAYIIPPQWTEVIDLVRLHGLRTRTLDAPHELEIESYRFTDVSFPPGPFEGRFEPRFKSSLLSERRTFPAGSVVVPLDQRDGRVAVFLLEPDAPDSLLSWGFFNPIFEQKEYAEDYVMERVAREMMAADPRLRAEFEEKVRTDHSFAADPHARLHFFYERSPYWDDHLNRYPIGRIVNTEELASTAVH